MGLNLAIELVLKLFLYLFQFLFPILFQNLFLSSAYLYKTFKASDSLTFDIEGKRFIEKSRECHNHKPQLTPRHQEEEKNDKN